MDKYVALIPARGGSKSIKLKNIKPICGRPLIYWSLDAAVNCEKIDKVYVTTDSEDIRKCVREYKEPNYQKIVLIDRSPETATDTASTESFMLEFANKVDFENVVLIQCTNPLIQTKDLDKAIDLYPNFDSLVSTVVQKRFYWEYNDDGSISEIGHDIRKRPRRQDWDGVLAENGSIYIISKNNLLKGKCRLYGRIGTYVMDEESYFEIDEPTDWIIIEDLLKYKMENKK